MDYNNPDWDPLKTLEDISQALLNQAMVINHLVEAHNQLNARITQLEQQTQRRNCD